MCIALGLGPQWAAGLEGGMSRPSSEAANHGRQDAPPNARSALDGASRTRHGSAAPVPRTALSVSEACQSLGVSWDTWSEHIAPTIKIVRLGRRQLVPVAELERWLAKNAEGVFDR